MSARDYSRVTVQLYLHEVQRVYRDRLISEQDFRRFDDMHQVCARA